MKEKSLGEKITGYASAGWIVSLIVDVIYVAVALQSSTETETFEILWHAFLYACGCYVLFMYLIRGLGVLICKADENAARLDRIEKRLGIKNEEETSTGEPGNQKRVEIVAPMSGKLISYNVKVGDKIEKEQLLCVIEADGVESTLSSPVSGTVIMIAVKQGEQFKNGALIMAII